MQMNAFNAMFRGLVLVGVVVLAGCATPPAPEARSTPSAVPAEGSGRIVFYRPNGVFGYLMRADILLDGKKVGESAPGMKFYVDTAPGIHHIVVPNSMYSGDRSLDVKVVEKGAVYVRTSLGGSAFGGRTNVELIGASAGEQESAGLDLVK